MTSPTPPEVAPAPETPRAAPVPPVIETASAAARVATVAGRDILVNPPTDVQLVLLRRAMSRASKAIDKTREDGPDIMVALDAASIALNIMQGLVVNLADADWLEDEMEAGRLDYMACMPLLTAYVDTTPEPTNRAGRRATRRA